MPVPYWTSSNGSTCHSSAAPAPAPAPARAPTVRPMPDLGPAHVPQDALELIERLIHFRSDVCSQFVYKWMELPRKVRKTYSYDGAIKCRSTNDPKHYFCQIEQINYFDPSNWVYAVTMRLMMPEMMKEVNWNNETKGDIFESILGYKYSVANGLEKKPVGAALSRHIGIVAAIFEEFVWYTWRLCDSIGYNNSDRVLQWVKWIIDMVAYRQMKDNNVGTLILHERPDEFVFRPRCKGQGNLI